MDFFHERIRNYLKHLLREGAVTLYRIVGPKYAVPPFFHPREFDCLVKSYDVELIELLHSYDGIARLHSHGRVKRVLTFFREMNIDAVDPLEPPPDGDVTLKEAREILGDKDDIERLVRKAIKEGSAGGGFIPSPTAMPITTPLKKKIRDNIIHYINCGIEYGGQIRHYNKTKISPGSKKYNTAKMN